MNLTCTPSVTKICPPRNIEGGRGNPFRTGDKTPQLSAVFLCPSFIHIMAGLLGQALCLVAPVRGISTPFNPATNDVEIIGGDYFIFRTGITA